MYPNAIVGDLGGKRIVKQSPLLLDGLETDLFPTKFWPKKGGIVIEGVLNPRTILLIPNDIGWEGIS